MMLMMMTMVVVVLVLSGLAELQQEQFQILCADTQAASCCLQRCLVSAVRHACSEIGEARPWPWIRWTSPLVHADSCRILLYSRNMTIRLSP